MTDLIALATTGKGSWTEVGKVINQGEWDKIYIVTNDFGLKKFSSGKNVNFVVIDPARNSQDIKDAVMKQLDGKLGMEIAFNMESGSGKEHMAVISALFNLGVGIRLVGSGEKEIKEI